MEKLLGNCNYAQLKQQGYFISDFTSILIESEMWSKCNYTLKN